MNTTTYKRSFKLGPIQVSILNFHTARFNFLKLPRRLVVDFLYWQVWFEKPK